MISIVQSEETSDKRQGSGVQLTSLAFQLYILGPVVELWDSVPSKPVFKQKRKDCKWPSPGGHAEHRGDDLLEEQGQRRLSLNVPVLLSGGSQRIREIFESSLKLL